MQQLKSVEPELSQSTAPKPNDIDIKLLPYVRIDGEYTLSDFVLHGFFQQLQEEKTAQIVFQDGFICNGVDFINFLKEPRNLPAFAFIDNKIVGVAWINGITGKHAFAHFALLKSIWGKHSEEVGKAYLQYWFALPSTKKEPLLDVILGFIPAKNSHALQFIKRLGFKQVGEIPSIMYNAIDHEYEAGVLSYIKR